MYFEVLLGVSGGGVSGGGCSPEVQAGFGEPTLTQTGVAVYGKPS